MNLKSSASFATYRSSASPRILETIVMRQKASIALKFLESKQRIEMRVVPRDMSRAGFLGVSTELLSISVLNSSGFQYLAK